LLGLAVQGKLARLQAQEFFMLVGVVRVLLTQPILQGWAVLVAVEMAAV
jgi:hypothetical protein